MDDNRTLLLHACCGPCTIEPLRLLQEAGWDVTVAYVNPNIHPRAEYDKRLDTLCAYAREKGVEVIEGDYDLDAWMREVAPLRDDREARCRACYRLRLRETARMARERGDAALGTTLSVSPYQLTQTIAEELAAAAEEQGLEAVFGDYRERYPEATRISRELGMYRQNYCGCAYSDAEAAEEREQRRRERHEAAERRAKERAPQEAAKAQERAQRKAERAAYDEQQRRKRAIKDALRAARKGMNED